MNVKDSVVLVTGANRGIGRAFVEGFVAAGARRVYAAARDLQSLPSGDRIVPLSLDVTDVVAVRAAADSASDVNVVVNNAGFAAGGGVTGRDDFVGARREMEVNYFGLMQVSEAFAPVLRRNQPGAFVNILSILALMGMPRVATYAASKSAALAATRAIRAELRENGIATVAVMPGFVDTDMTAHVTAPKLPPSAVVRAAIDALEQGAEEIFPGAQAAELARSFFADHRALEAAVSL